MSAKAGVQITLETSQYAAWQFQPISLSSRLAHLECFSST